MSVTICTSGDAQGLVHYEFIPEWHNENRNDCQTPPLPKGYRENKMPEKCVQNSWFLLHDNAPAW
jgi:hypothetical protein